MTTIETGWLLTIGTVYSYHRDHQLGRESAWRLAEAWSEMPWPHEGITIAPARIVVDA